LTFALHLLKAGNKINPFENKPGERLCNSKNKDRHLDNLKAHKASMDWNKTIPMTRSNQTSQADFRRHRKSKWDAAPSSHYRHSWNCVARAVRVGSGCARNSRLGLLRLSNIGSQSGSAQLVHEACCEHEIAGLNAALARKGT
jgi:hypothetical protein